MTFLPQNDKIWFVFRRTGWRPCCWQGWVVLLIFIALIIALPEFADPEHRTLYTLLLTAGLIGICTAKSRQRP